MSDTMATDVDAPPLLAMRHITKTFAGVTALADVNLTVGRGEVHALVGENGAGKSTLIKILTGAYRPGLRDSIALSELLLEKAAVAVVPGAAFGSDDHIRISFACSRATLTEGLERIAAALAG